MKIQSINNRPSTEKSNTNRKTRYLKAFEKPPLVTLTALTYPQMCPLEIYIVTPNV